MHPTAERFAEAANERHGVDVDVHEFEAGTKTAAAAAEAIGCDVAQIASSLVFLADGDPVVVVTSGANRVSEGRLVDAVSAGDGPTVDGSSPGAADVEMAGPDDVKAATGWSIGGVPPICHETDVPVLFDETLLDHATVWAAAGTPETVWPVDPATLVDLAGARVADVAD